MCSNTYNFKYDQPNSINRPLAFQLAVVKKRLLDPAASLPLSQKFLNVVVKHLTYLQRNDLLIY